MRHFEDEFLTKMILSNPKKALSINIHTEQDPPSEPWIELPQKKPFLILVFSDYDKSKEYLEQFHPFIKSLGLRTKENDQLIVTITSSRKVAAAIDKLCSDEDYQTRENEVVLSQLSALKAIYEHSLTPIKMPPKGKNLSQFTVLTEPVHRLKEVPSPLHQTQKVSKNNHTDILKIDRSGRRINEIAAFNGLCYRLLLNDAMPKIHSGHDDTGNRMGVLSREIADFQTLHDYYIKIKKRLGFMQSPPQADLIKAKIGRVLAAAYSEEENDLHGGNIAYLPRLPKCYLFDTDQTTWPLVAKYRGKDPQKVNPDAGVKPIDAFPITQRDLNQFPHLVDAKPEQFPDHSDSQLLDLTGIENNAEFNSDVFTIFLKRILLNTNHYRAAAQATIANQKLQQEFVNHKVERGIKLRTELLKNERFIRFVASESRLKEKIIAEFEQYNLDYPENSSLRIDISEITTEFDKIHHQSIEKFNKIQSQAEEALRLIIDDVIKLDGKLGWIGGNTRYTQEGKKIIIPNGAAAIFDEYQKVKRKECLASEALATIITRAQRADDYHGHYFFNRRQKETSDFYQRVKVINIDALFQTIDEKSENEVNLTNNTPYI